VSTPSKGIKNHIQKTDFVAIYEFLKSPDVLRKNVDTGLVYYMNGWDDARIAERFTKELGSPITPHNVAGIRDPLFGHLARVQKTSRIEALEARVAELEAKVERLEF
jgi:hypothetical protein